MRRTLVIRAVFFYLIAFLVLLMPLYVEAGERMNRGGGIIETGDARSDTAVVTRVNVSRTRIEICEDPALHKSEEPQGQVSSDTNAVIVRTNNEAFVSNVGEAGANTGGNSTGVGGESSDGGMTQVSLRELGLLQLAAHDLFNVDRMTEVDTENGDLDLSTLLDYGYGNIAIGGENRNRENIMLFTVASEYGMLYIKLLDRGNTPLEARKKLIRKYHKELEELYEELFHEDFPEPAAGSATMTENLAFRTIHDFLPGHIRVEGELVITVDPSLIGKKLTRSELKEKSGKLDGVFDPVFRDIVIVIPPATVLHIDLLERDSSFAAQFGTDHTFEHFLAELVDGLYDGHEDVMHYIRNLFAKGLYFD